MSSLSSKINLNYIILIFMLVFSVAYPANKFFQLPNFWTWAGATLLASTVLFFGMAQTAVQSDRFRFLYSLIPAALLFLYCALYGIFGEFDFTSIIFHLEMGTGGGLPDGLIKSIIKFSVSFSLFIAAFFVLINLDQRFLIVDRALCIPLLLVNPLLWSAGEYLFIHRYDDGLLKAYHAPNAVSVPAGAAKNLIIIYAESAERTFADISHGDYVFSEMMQLASSGMHIRGIRHSASGQYRLVNGWLCLQPMRCAAATSRIDTREYV